MSLFSKIGDLLSGAFAGSESKINDLTRAVARAFAPGTDAEKTLEILRQEAERKFTPQVQVQIFRKKLHAAGLPVDGPEEVRLHVVAIGNTILNLMGVDTMVHGEHGGDRIDRIQELCQVQGARIVPSALDQEALQETLSRCFAVKSAWKASGHPGLEVCRITDPEVKAHQDWSRTHPAPDR